MAAGQTSLARRIGDGLLFAQDHDPDYHDRRLQHEVFRADGTLAGTTDWAWEEYGLLGEFDGRTKYGRLLKPNESPGDAVFKEKVREDELRELTGCAMIRLTWPDLSKRESTAARVRRLMRPA